MINLGSLGITDMKIGTSTVLSGYVGTTLIYPSVPIGPYTFCEYIAPTGTTYGNNFISISGVQCTTSFFVRTNFRPLAAASNTYIGFLHSSDSADWRLFYTGGRLYFDYGSSRVYKSVSSADFLDKDYNYTLYNYGVYDEDSEVEVLTGTTQATAPDLNNFRLNAGYMRIYGVAAFDGERKIFDLKPAVRNSDGVAGLYDMVSGNFYAVQTPESIGAYGTPKYTYENSIYGTGNNNYIWFPVSGTTTLEYEWEGEFVRYANNIIFGWTGSTNGEKWNLYYPNSSDTNSYYFRLGSSNNITTPASSLPLNENVVLRMGNFFVKKNGSVLTSGNTTTVTTAHPVCLNTRATKTKRLQLFDGGKIVLDGIPALRNSDSKAGLFDTVRGRFYTNGTIYYDEIVPSGDTSGSTAGFRLESVSGLSDGDRIILVEPQEKYAVGNSAHTISFSGFTGEGDYGIGSLPDGIDVLVYNGGNYLTFSDGVCANANDFSDWNANPVTAFLEYGCGGASRQSKIAGDGTVYTVGNSGDLSLYRTAFDAPRFMSHSNGGYKKYYAYKITYTYD